MDARECVIYWGPLGSPNPEHRGRAEVKRLGQNSDLPFSGGAVYPSWRDATDRELALRILTTFHSMVVRDGIAPDAAHEALLALDQYRRFIAPDIKGADNPDDLGDY